MASCIRSRVAFVPVASKSQRMRNIRKLNKIFYERVDLGGPGLHSLTKGRRLQFSSDEDQYEMIIHKDIWKTKRDTWDGMANILNTWSVGDQVREKIKDMSDDAFIIKFIIADND